MPTPLTLNSNRASRLKQLEALLFAAPALTTLDQLARALALPEVEVEGLLNELARHYEAEHGLRLQQINQQYQLVTAPEFGKSIEEFLGLEVTSRLTQAALETLAVIAYKQPATRPDIEAIRGVNSDAVVKSLLAKGLIQELGRSEAAGRPILYGVTAGFLEHFGLESLDQLPVLDLEGLMKREPEKEDDKQRLLKD